METIEQFKDKISYVKDVKKYLKENRSIEIENMEGRFKQLDMTLRAVRYILETPEGVDIIEHAESIMQSINYKN
jgi:predicted aldo/keto reductase-like oxidoreductase